MIIDINQRMQFCQTILSDCCRLIRYTVNTLRSIALITTCRTLLHPALLLSILHLQLNTLTHLRAENRATVYLDEIC